MSSLNNQLGCRVFWHFLISFSPGDFPDVEVVQDESSEVDITSTVSEVTKGVATGRYVQLQYGESPATYLIEYNQLSANEVCIVQPHRVQPAEC